MKSSNREHKKTGIDEIIAGFHQTDLKPGLVFLDFFAGKARLFMIVEVEEAGGDCCCHQRRRNGTSTFPSYRNGNQALYFAQRTKSPLEEISGYNSFS